MRFRTIVLCCNCETTITNGAARAHVIELPEHVFCDVCGSPLMAMTRRRSQWLPIGIYRMIVPRHGKPAWKLFTRISRVAAADTFGEYNFYRCSRQGLQSKPVLGEAPELVQLALGDKLNREFPNHIYDIPLATTRRKRGS